MKDLEAKELTKVLHDLTGIKLPHTASNVRFTLSKMLTEYHRTFVPESEQQPQIIEKEVKK